MTKIGETIRAILARVKESEALLRATQAQVFSLREELAATKAELAKAVADLSKEKERLANIQLEGDFSPPMTKKEMAAILKLRPRSFGTFAKSHGLRKIGRQQFQIRLNAMDVKTRKKFE